MKKFYVDAETDGLYGRFLSVAALVTDGNGSELDRFYTALRTDGSDIRSEWVKQNVLPYLSNALAFVDTEEELLDHFWAFWMKHRENAACITNVPYPVEARLFTACVRKDTAAREFLGPFPLYDLCTLAAAQGYGSDPDMAALSGLELTPHDAMNDVRIMAAVWEKLTSDITIE